MSVQLRDYQIRDVENVRAAFARGARRVLLVSPTGSGKCLGRDTPVLMFDGSIKPVQDVIVGDSLMGPDSMPRTVLSLARGRERMYKVTPCKGDSYYVNESHILSLKMTGGSAHSCGIAAGTIMNVDVLAYLAATKTFRHCAKGWRAAVDFPTRANRFQIEPYFLGLWVGDGTSNGPTITSGDSEIAEYLLSYASRLGMSVRVEENSANSKNYHIKDKSLLRSAGRGHRTNPLRNALRSLHLLDNKHIPIEFKCGSRQTRLEVLAGIIDADGSLQGNGFDITLVNERLLDDVIFIARSLGFACYKSPTKKVCGNNGKSGTYYRCHINGSVDTIPCLLERKKANARRQKKDPLSVGIRVDPVGEDDYFGFEISGDRLFMLGDFTVTHNTVMFAHITSGVARKGKRVTVMAHRDFLLAQISDALKKFDVSHGILRGGSRGITRQQVAVASVFTLARRLEHYPAPDLIIGDECHHFTQQSTWGKAVAAFPRARVLGVTATPCRLDQQGLGDMFDEMVVGSSVAELTAQGYLTPAEVYAPSHTPDLRGLRRRGGDYAADDLEAVMDEPAITGDAVSHYQTLAPGTQAVGFCCSIRHAEHTASQFNAAGIPSAAVHGRMDGFDRTKVFRAYERRELRAVFAADLISEGFDCPAIETVILLRPTESLALYLQQVGRGIRPAPGKTKTIVLDAAGNTGRFGFIDEPRNWVLKGTQERRQQGEKAAPVRVCPVCFAMHRPTPVCPKCGHAYEVAGRMVGQVDGELVQMTSAADLPEVPVDGDLLELERTYHILVNIAKARQYSSPEKWAFDIVSGKLAQKQATRRDVPDETVNGLSADELDDLRRRTIMRAMSREEQPRMEGM